MIAQVRDADDQGAEHHPAAIVGHVHEAQIGRALQDVGDAVGQAGAAVGVAEQALDDQRQAERQQQAVEVIQLVQPADNGPLQNDPEDAHQQRRQDQRRKVADAEIVQQHPRRERPHHEQRAVGEVDDVEHAEDHRQPQREHGVEGAVDQPEQKLAEQQRSGNAEDRHHDCCFISFPRARRS